jgi:hypothetical protein
MNRLKREKICTAYHEAGHYVTARHFGIPVSACLWPVHRDRPRGGTFKTWKGQCDTQGRVLLSPHQQRIHCVAGAIAQIAWQNKTAEQYMPDWTEVLDFMSPSDCTFDDELCDFGEMAEREWQKWWQAMVETHAMLNRENGPLWPTVQRVARRLLTTKPHYIQLKPREYNAAWSRVIEHYRAAP